MRYYMVQVYYAGRWSNAYSSLTIAGCLEWSKAPHSSAKDLAIGGCLEWSKAPHPFPTMELAIGLPSRIVQR